MRFVNDKDFVTIARRTKPHIFPQLAHLVNAPIGGRVDLDDVHRIADGHFAATGASVARGDGGAGFAIQAASQDAGDGSFARPALSGKDVAVGDAALGDGVFDRRPHGFLTQEFVEPLRPVLAGDDLVGFLFRHGFGESTPNPG